MNESSNGIIMSYKEYANKRIKDLLKDWPPEKQTDKLIELLTKAEVEGKGISTIISEDEDLIAIYKKQKPVPDKRLVEGVNMKSMPGYDEIEKRIEESQQEKIIKEEIVEETDKKEIKETMKEIDAVSQKIVSSAEQIQDNDPNTASIYRTDALNAVKEDNKEHPRKTIITFEDTGAIEEGAKETIQTEAPTNVKTKVLSNPNVPSVSKTNDAWSSAGEPVSPGTLNL